MCWWTPSTEQVFASTFYSLAAVGLWIFLGPLWARVRRGSEWLALVAVIGGVVVGAVLLFSAGVSLVAWVAADYEDAGAARFLMVAGWETARVAVAPALVMVGATTLAGVRYGVFGSGNQYLRRNLQLPAATGAHSGVPGGPHGVGGGCVGAGGRAEVGLRESSCRPSATRAGVARLSGAYPPDTNLCRRPAAGKQTHPCRWPWTNRLAKCWDRCSERHGRRPAGGGNGLPGTCSLLRTGVPSPATAVAL